MATVWFDGLEELNTVAASMGRAGPVAGAKAQQVVASTAAGIEGDAKAFAPVDTGNLRASISRTVGVLAAEVGPTADYGAYVELGTDRMAPAAYMGPAFDRWAGTFVAGLAAVAGTDPTGPT